MDKDRDYLVLGTEGMVDISSGSPRSAGHYSKNRYEKSGKGKKKTVIIASVAAAVVVVLGAAGFVVFQNFKNKPIAGEAEKQFVFTAKTTVSGIDITGKNLKQAKLLLELNKDKFINPISLSVDVNGEYVELTQDDFNYEFNIEDVLEQAKKDAESGEKPNSEDGSWSYEIVAAVTEESINKNVGNICDDTDTDPIDARVSAFHPYASERFEYAEAVDGCKVDDADLKTKFINAFAQGNNFCKIEADVQTETADTDVEFLKSNLVKLASYETYSTNTANGTTNMKVSLEACNGSVIEPGAVWSFNGCTGDSNQTSLGYKSAHVISEGKLVDGIGGGICQSSSTIYNAAIRANMDVEERYNHKWASSYVPTGLDATIDYPNLDLKLSNPTSYQMFLECKVVDNNLYATFWGVKTGDYDEIRTHNELDSSGKSTYSVRAWRVYFKDGKEIDREELPKSTYDMDYGVVFHEADNDSKAVDRDIDDLSDTSSQEEPSAASSKPAETEPSRTEEPSYTEPPTEAPQVTDPPTQEDPTPVPDDTGEDE